MNASYILTSKTLTKNMNVTHAALGTSAFVLVSTNDDLSNTLLFHKFSDAWTQNTDWTIPMPKDEQVQSKFIPLSKLFHLY